MIVVVLCCCCVALGGLLVLGYLICCAGVDSLGCGYLWLWVAIDLLICAG